MTRTEGGKCRKNDTVLKRKKQQCGYYMPQNKEQQQWGYLYVSLRTIT